MVIDTPFLHCFFCGRRFSPDLEARQGSFLHAWKVTVCIRCLDGNRQGLPASHPAVGQLARRGLFPKPAKNGIVSWPDSVAGWRDLG